MTDNKNRTAPDMRLLFKNGQLGTSGSNKFLFDHVGIIEAHHPDTGADLEGAAIEAGANDFEGLTHEQNDDIPEGAAGVRLLADGTAVHSVSQWLSANGWTVVTSEIGYVAKILPRVDRRAAGRDGRVFAKARRLRRRGPRLGGGEVGVAPPIMAARVAVSS